MTTPSTFQVWRGVYSSFAEAPKTGPGFSGEEWIERTRNSMRLLLSSATEGRMDFSLLQRNVVLTALAGAILATADCVRILDFGGGMGAGFLLLQSTIPQAASTLDYHIVELEGVCRAGRELYSVNNSKTAVDRFLVENDRSENDTRLENKLLLTLRPTGLPKVSQELAL